MDHGLLICPDGRVEELTIPSEGSSLPLLYEAISCHAVDVVQLTSVLDMWIDDNGYEVRDLNPWATLLARHHGWKWQDYYGPVVLTSVDATGNTIGLTSAQLCGVLTHLGDLVA